MSERKKISLARRAGLGVLGAAIGAVGGYFMSDADPLGMAGGALVLGLGFAFQLGGDGPAGMGGDGGGE
ncbi:MAG: hypothetical protein ACFE0P_14365 [Oceanicaulis sp.]